MERPRRHEDVAGAAATHRDDHVGVDADEGGPLGSRGLSGLDHVVEGATGHRDEGILGGVGEENERLRGHRRLLVQRVAVGHLYVAAGRAVDARQLLGVRDLHGNDLRALGLLEQRRLVELFRRLRGRLRGQVDGERAGEGGGEEVAVDERHGLQRGRDDGERGAGEEIVVAVERGEVVATAPAREEVGVGENVVGGERGVDLADEARLLALERR